MPAIGFIKTKLIVHVNLWEKQAQRRLFSVPSSERFLSWKSTAEAREWALKNGYSGIKVTTK